LKKLLLASAAFFAAGAAHASIIPILSSVTPDSGLYRFTYEASLAPDAGLVNGSQFVIFDFAGFSDGLTADPSFLASSELTTAGYTLPPGVTDDPTIDNLVFTWNGGDFQTTGGPFDSTTFTVSALSSFGDVQMDGYGALTVVNNGPAQGSVAVNSGTTAVPAIPGTAAVPEPAAWAMMILGFGGVGALIRRRREALEFAA
jgi:hypothetical protein